MITFNEIILNCSLYIGKCFIIKSDTSMTLGHFILNKCGKNILIFETEDNSKIQIKPSMDYYFELCEIH